MKFSNTENPTFKRFLRFLCGPDIPRLVNHRDNIINDYPAYEVVWLEIE
jgi:hypothetical protein